MNNSVFGVVCICSRGLIHSRTVEAVDKNMNNASDIWVREFTHNQPIPDAQNSIVEKARAHKPEWLWFVEEDMEPTEDTLSTLLEQTDNCRVVSAKYKLRGGTWAHFPSSGPLVFTGLGCLLVHLSVFDQIGFPYFRTDRQYSFSLKKAGENVARYGGQDIYFFAQLKKHGIKPKLIDLMCGHLTINKFGDLTNNIGFHSVEKV